MSKALSELNALCDVLSFMRTPTAFPSAKQMYKHFCKPGAGVITICYVATRYRKTFKICKVNFEYLSWLGMVSSVQIDTTKYY